MNIFESFKNKSPENPEGGFSLLEQSHEFRRKVADKVNTCLFWAFATLALSILLPKESEAQVSDNLQKDQLGNKKIMIDTKDPNYVDKYQALNFLHKSTPNYTTSSFMKRVYPKFDDIQKYKPNPDKGLKGSDIKFFNSISPVGWNSWKEGLSNPEPKSRTSPLISNFPPSGYYVSSGINPNFDAYNYDFNNNKTLRPVTDYIEDRIDRNALRKDFPEYNNEEIDDIVDQFRLHPYHWSGKKDEFASFRPYPGSNKQEDLIYYKNPYTYSYPYWNEPALKMYKENVPRMGTMEREALKKVSQLNLPISDIPKGDYRYSRKFGNAVNQFPNQYYYNVVDPWGDTEESISEAEYIKRTGKIPPTGYYARQARMKEKVVEAAEKQKMKKITYSPSKKKYY